CCSHRSANGASGDEASFGRKHLLDRSATAIGSAASANPGCRSRGAFSVHDSRAHPWSRSGRCLSASYEGGQKEYRGGDLPSSGLRTTASCRLRLRLCLQLRRPASSAVLVRRDTSATHPCS